MINPILAGTGYDYSGAESAFIPTPQDNDDVNIGIPYQPTKTNKTQPTKNNGTKPTNTAGQKVNSKPSFVPESEQVQARPNPLSNYSSYTYNLSLYMATPEALNNFITSGKFDPKDDFYIVAQSGGISAQEKRALTLSGKLGPNEPGLDYYIDDLDVKLTFTGTDGTPTVGTNIRFRITEPIGFSFFNKLSVVSGMINDLSPMLKESNARPPPLSQNYIIGVRFYGYDEFGDLAKAESFQAKSKFLNKSIPEGLSSVSEYATYERFFTFQITAVNYQLDGKIVVYDVEGTPISKQIGHGTKFGTVKVTTNLVAGTVKEAIVGSETKTKSSNSSRGLIQALNEHQQAEKASKLCENPSTFEVVWGKGTEELQNSGLIIDKKTANESAPTSSATSTKESNVKTAEATQSIPSGKKQIPVNAGTPVIQLMDQIMTKSDYVANKLTAKNSEAIETKTTETDPTAILAWYSINPIVKVGGRDPIRKDWFYDITYVIEMQQLEYVKSLYNGNLAKWRGAHKKYDFFYTGQNSEIINFEQKYNNQFYVLQAMTTNSIATKEDNTTPSNTQGGSAGVPVASQQNKGSQIAETTAISVNSPADQATAQIRIVGDPDYLMSNVGGTYVGVTNQEFKNRYGVDPNTMNPYKGQIWIEIKFMGADDYMDDGTLNIIDVDFYKMINNYNNDGKSGPKKQNIGMIYRIIAVDSKFSNGRFTQDLELVIVGESELLGTKYQEKKEEMRASGNNGVKRNPNESASYAKRGAILNSQAGAGHGVVNPPVNIEAYEAAEARRVAAERLARMGGKNRPTVNPKIAQVVSTITDDDIANTKAETSRFRNRSYANAIDPVRSPEEYEAELNRRLLQKLRPGGS